MNEDFKDIIRKVGSLILFIIGGWAIYWGIVELLFGSAFSLLGGVALFMILFGGFGIKFSVSLWRNEEEDPEKSIANTLGIKIISLVLFLEGTASIYDININNSYYENWWIAILFLMGVFTIAAAIQLWRLKKQGLYLSSVVIAIISFYFGYKSFEILQMTQEQIGEFFTPTAISTIIGIYVFFHLLFLGYLWYNSRKFK